METVEILRHILSCQGSVDREELECNLGDASFIAEILTNNKDIFVSCWVEGTQKVVVQSPFKLCRARECSDCGGLHVCKNLLLSGDCCFQQRRGCRFSHDLQSEDNTEVLRKFGLETLSRSELCLLLLQSNNTLLPAICHDYNNRSGCQGESQGVSQGVCPRLHVCEGYLSHSHCNRTHCTRTHDFSAPQPLKLLLDKHIPEHLFKVLKSVYANKEALRQSERGKVKSDTCEAVDCSQEDQISTEDWSVYDSDSSHCSVSTNQSESSNPRKREGRRRGGRRRTQKTTSAAGGVQNKDRCASQGPKTSEERRNNRQQSRGKNTNPTNNSSNAAVHKSDAKSKGKQSQGKRDETEICMFFIIGFCREQGACPKAHDMMPYRWEIKQGGRWTPLADNERIEEDYCDPQNMYSTTCSPVHFQVAQDGHHTMTCGTNKVRRLSTVNSVLKPHYSYTTDWLWYFKDEKGQWIEYSAAINLFDISKQEVLIITSEELEKRYLQNNHDIVTFCSRSYSFMLTFRDMIQTNLKYGTVRLVRRRPRFVSAAEVESKRKCDKAQIRQTEHMNDTSMKKDSFSTPSQQIALATTLNKSRPVSATASVTSKTGLELASASATKSQFTLPAPEAMIMAATKSSNPMLTNAASLKPQPMSGLSQFPTPQTAKLATTSKLALTTTLGNMTSGTKPQATTLHTTNAATPFCKAQVTSTTTLPTNSQFIFPQTSPTTFGATAVKSATNPRNVFSPTAPVLQLPSRTLQSTVFDSATPSTPQFPSSTISSNPLLIGVSSNAQLTKAPEAITTSATKSSNAQATKLSTASQITVTTTVANMTSETKPQVTTLQIATTPPDRLSASREAQVTTATTLPTNSQFIFLQTCPSTFGTSAVKSTTHPANVFSPTAPMSQFSSLTPQTTVFDPATPSANKRVTKAHLAFVTKSSNLFSTDLAPLTSQRKITESQFTLGTATNMTTTPQITSSTKSTNPFLTDVSSNAQLATTKSKLAFPTPQNTPNISHASSAATKSGTKSGGTSTIATTSVTTSRVWASTSTSQFGSEANSPDTFASASKSQLTTAASAAVSQHSLTTTARPKSTVSKINSPNAFSGSSARSQLPGSSKLEMTILTTPATKSATISKRSLTTTFTSNVSEPFPTITAKSLVTSPEAATQSHFEAVRSAGTSSVTNTQVAKFKSASPLGYAAVSFSGATTSTTGSTTVSSTATEKINEKQKNCVIL